MTQLSALSVVIRGDTGHFQTAMRGVRDSLTTLGNQFRQFGASAGAAVTNAFKRLASMSDTVRFRLQMVSYQVQDVAVQLAAGARASTVFAQQGSQVLSIFGPMGAMLGALAAVTLPLLAVAFSGGAEAASKYKDAIAGIAEETERLRAETEKLRWGVQTEQEAEILNQIAARKKEIAAIEQQLAGYQKVGAHYLNEYANGLDAQREKLVALIAADQERLDKLKQGREAHREVQGILGGIQGQMSGIIGQAIAWAAQIAKVAEQYKKIPHGGRATLTPFVGTTNRPAFGSLGIVDGPKAPAVGGGGGGGGGGVNPIVGELDALRTSLMTQEEAQIASYARQQETLRAALEQRLLTQQEYAGLMEQANQQHADRMSQIDVWRYGTGLDKAETFFGSMAQAFQGGNEKMLKIAKAFGAAQALISAYQGAAEALKLPFPENMAAYAKVLATGLGAVAQIQSASPGASGAIGGGPAGGLNPQTVRVQGLDPTALFTGASVSGIFDAIMQEAGDRGVRIITA